MPNFQQIQNHRTPEVQLGYLMTFLTDEQKERVRTGIYTAIDQGIADPYIVCEIRREVAFDRVWESLLTYTVNMSNTFRLNGQVNYTDRLIRLSGSLLRSGKYELTLLHEIAHIVDHIAFKGRGHGYTWKMCDRALGGTGQRCSNRDAPKEEIMKMPVVYSCPNGHLTGQSRRSSGVHTCGRCSRKFDLRYKLTQIK